MKHSGGTFGSHKHGISGHSGPNGKTKFQVNKVVNELSRKTRRQTGRMYGSVQDLMRDRKR